MHLNPKLGICPICHNESGDILLRSTPNGDIRLVEEEDHQKHQLSPSPCKECQSRLDEDYIAFIPVNAQPSGRTISNEVFHDNRASDEIMWLKEKAFTAIFDNEPPKGRVIACEPEVITALKEIRESIAVAIRVEVVGQSVVVLIISPFDMVPQAVSVCIILDDDFIRPHIQIPTLGTGSAVNVFVGPP